MFVTSTSEVQMPTVPEFIVVLLNQSLDIVQLRRRKAVVSGELDARFQPVLRLAVSTNDMNVHSGFFP
jgi:ABC-type phosphate transport system auxiliary subunit